jgi:hypothetical protein
LIAGSVVRDDEIVARIARVPSSAMTPVKERIGRDRSLNHVFARRMPRHRGGYAMKKNAPQPAPVPSAFGDTLSGIAAANQKAMEAAARMSARSMQGMVEAQQHLFDFAARRLNRDLDAARRLSACKAPPEVLAVTQALCAEAMADYAEEATALMRVGTSAMGAVAAR